MDTFSAQISNETAEDRYPNVFNAVRYLCRYRDPASLRILSFGCSTGEEVASLAKTYFPGAQIVGLDINESVLEIAKRRNSIPNVTTYDVSSPDAIARHGPYDVVFAMGVLCRWPETKKLADISDVFPFRTFSYLVRCLHDQLKSGGIFVVNGANYQFLDTDISDLYATVLVGTVGNNGIPKRFDRSGKAQLEHLGTDSIYLKLGSQDRVTEGTFRNIYVANGDGDLIGVLSISRK